MEGIVALIEKEKPIMRSQIEKPKERERQKIIWRNSIH